MKKLIKHPVSLIWNTIHRARRAKYLLDGQSLKLGIPTISIGNLSFGGTGKTPFIRELIEYLEAKDKKVVVCSRGYKSQNEADCFQTARETKQVSVAELGDENYFLYKKSKRAEFIIGKKRSQNLESYFENNFADICILDDGFQHIQVERDFNVVLIDISIPFEQYQCAPLGSLREDLATLKYADAIVFTKTAGKDAEKIIEAVKRNCRSECIFSFACFQTIDNKFVGREVFAFSAIASHSSFIELLKNENVNVTADLSFPDHYIYRKKDLEKIRNKAGDSLILCTEKDVDKVKDIDSSFPCEFLPVRLKLTDGERQFFKKVDSYVL